VSLRNSLPFAAEQVSAAASLVGPIEALKESITDLQGEFKTLAANRALSGLENKNNPTR
jgi:hypothetical protein